MQQYDDDMLQELCNHIDLYEYASRTMDFEQRGNDEYATHCPRHVDKTPSLFITPSKNLFHCFSCGCGGNIISWFMTFEHLSYDEAVKKVCNMAGGDIQHLHQCNSLSIFKQMRDVKQSKKKAIPYREILEETAFERFSEEIPSEWVEEGIDPEIMKKYQIRVDQQANRIVYPVYDNQLRLIGFKGRTRFPNYKELGIKKYMNYQKIGTINYFVGMKENQDSIRKKDEVIIFEGIKSGMKVEAWGYDNWLASETSCLNDEQVSILIQMHIKNVVIAFDNDVPLTKIQACIGILCKFTNVYVILDPKRILGDPSEKLSPCDKGREIWEELYAQRRKV